MVAPERDRPGISARHCQKPMIRASRQRSRSSETSPGFFQRSVTNSITPLTIRNAAASRGAPKPLRRMCSKSPPTITAGMVATTTFSKSRRSAAARGPRRTRTAVPNSSQVRQK